VSGADRAEHALQRADDLRSQFIAGLAEPTNVIGGADLRGGAGAFADACPATGIEIARVPESDSADIDAAVASAREAQKQWWAMDGAERARRMLDLADAIEARRDQISLIESIDNGRPRRETASQAAIVARWFRYYAGITDKLEGSSIPVAGPYLNYTRRLPVGVCTAITPWNHPLLIATKKVAPAIACGNGIVVKPSELAPLSVIEMARIAVEAGLPRGLINVVNGGRQAGETLTAHAGIDRVDVTGSTPTGISVARAAAGTLKRVGMELGGKAANIAFPVKDLDRLARGAIFAAFIAQGQSCVAGSRLLAHVGIADELGERIAALAADIKLGDPLATETQMGPVISLAAADRIRGEIGDAVAKGGELLCGGDASPELDEGLRPAGFIRPTVIRVDDRRAPILRTEVFGPVLTITAFRDEDEAVDLANDVPYGLGAAVWTDDVSQAHRVSSRLRSGVVWINDYHRIDPASPWGGFKLSGYGRENGSAAVEEYTAPQSVWVPLEAAAMDWYEHSGESRLN
jgi:acyl-CoA reductase-like NAD-dependent aldehyde dehydrogenase